MQEKIQEKENQVHKVTSIMKKTLCGNRFDKFVATGVFSKQSQAEVP